MSRRRAAAQFGVGINLKTQILAIRSPYHGLASIK
jgi:hypothetical protein